MRARGRYEDRNSILHNWSDYGSWSHACLVTALGETMTPEERARLIEQYEKGLEDWDLKPFTIDESRAIISDLRRLDVLEKALRELVEAISFEGESNHYDTVINNCFTKAKLALGDA